MKRADGSFVLGEVKIKLCCASEGLLGQQFGHTIDLGRLISHGSAEKASHTRFCAIAARRRNAKVTVLLVHVPVERHASKQSTEDCVISSSSWVMNCCGTAVTFLGNCNGRSGIAGCIFEILCRRYACTLLAVCCHEAAMLATPELCQTLRCSTITCKNA